MDEVEENARKNTLYDVNDVITSKWGDSVIQPFGSYPVGLSIFLSDIDVSILGMGVDDEKTTQKDSQQRRFTNEFQRGVTSSSTSASQQRYQNQNQNRNQDQHKIIDLTHGNDNSCSDRKKLAGGRTGQNHKSSVDGNDVNIRIDCDSSSKENPIQINDTSDEGEDEDEEVVSWALDTASLKEIIVSSTILSPALKSLIESAISNQAVAEVPKTGILADISQDELFCPSINLSTEDPISREILNVTDCDSSCADIVNTNHVPLADTAADTGVVESSQIKSESQVISMTKDAFIDNSKINNEKKEQVLKVEMNNDCNISLSSCSDIIPIKVELTNNTVSNAEIPHLQLTGSVEEHSSTSVKNIILGNIECVETECSVIDDNEHAIISRIIEGVPLLQAMNSGNSISGGSKKRRREEKLLDINGFEISRSGDDDSDRGDVSEFKMDNDLLDDCDSSDYSNRDSDDMEGEVDEEEDDENDENEDDYGGLTEDEDELFDEECRGSRARIKKISTQRASKRKAAVRMDLDRLQGLDSKKDFSDATNISEKSPRNGKKIVFFMLIFSV